MLRPFILISFLSGATGALANPVPLTNEELKEAVAGSVVEIDTPLGTTVPMRFGTDGLVSAEAGVLAPVLGSAKDRGRWWVDGDKLCTKWFRWFDAGVRCLTIARDGARIYWRKIDDGETGTGTLVNRMEPKQKKEKPAVVAKAAPPPEPPQSKPAEPEAKPAPEPEKRASRLATPPREEPAAKQGMPSADPAPAPTVVARAEVAESSDSVDDGPMMRFGGAGLLEASSRIGTDAQAAEQAPAATVVEPLPVPRKAPAKAAGKDAAAPAGKAGQPAAAQRQASSQAAAPEKRTAQKRAPAARERTASVTTSSTRALPLYRVTGVHRSDVLNVRRGPSEEHARVAYIPPTGRQVQITGQCRAEWCPIRYGDITGWVHSYYLAEDRPMQGSASQVYVAKP